MWARIPYRLSEGCLQYGRLRGVCSDFQNVLPLQGLGAQRQLSVLGSSAKGLTCPGEMWMLSEISARCEQAERLPWRDLKGSLRETTGRRERRRGPEKLEMEGGSMGKQRELCSSEGP